jgi:hypothetical protein
LGPGCPQDLIAEVTAQILRGAEVYLSPIQERRQLDFNPRHANQAGLAARFEFDKQVDVAIGPRRPASVDPNRDKRRI